MVNKALPILALLVLLSGVQHWLIRRCLALLFVTRACHPRSTRATLRNKAPVPRTADERLQHTYVHIYIHIYIWTYICMDIYVYTHCLYLHTYVFMEAMDMHTCIHNHTNNHFYTPGPCDRASGRRERWHPRPAPINLSML